MRRFSRLHPKKTRIGFSFFFCLKNCKKNIFFLFFLLISFPLLPNFLSLPVTSSSIYLHIIITWMYVISVVCLRFRVNPHDRFTIRVPEPNTFCLPSFLLEWPNLKIELPIFFYSKCRWSIILFPLFTSPSPRFSQISSMFSLCSSGIF